MAKKTKRETAAAFLREHGEEAYSRRRVEKDEERNAAERGYGTTRQADALYREYCDQLVTLINANRINPRRNRDVWAALQGPDVMRGLEVEDIAERIFKLGLTVAMASSIGVDRKGVKNARDVLLWLGDKLSQLQRIDNLLPRSRTRAQVVALNRAARQLADGGKVELHHWLCTSGKPGKVVVMRPGFRVDHPGDVPRVSVAPIATTH